jgi:hypothetical protein
MVYEKVFKLKVKLPDGRVVLELSPGRSSSQGVVLSYSDAFRDTRTGREVKNRCGEPPIKT